MAKQKYLMDGVQSDGKAYVRAWAEGRGRNAVFVVQVWPGAEPKGEPSSIWEMPKALGLEAAVAQAILQTPGVKQPEDATAKKEGPSRLEQFLGRIRTTMGEFEDIPEKEMYNALLEESDGWKMRLEELEEDGEGTEPGEDQEQQAAG